MDLMASRRMLMAAANKSGYYDIDSGDIETSSATPTIEIPLKRYGTPISAIFFLKDHENYDPTEHNLGMVGGIWQNNVFWFTVPGNVVGDFTYPYIILYSFYSGNVDYWRNGVSATQGSNAIVISNTRSVKTIPGAKYEYYVVYRKT